MSDLGVLEYSSKGMVVTYTRVIQKEIDRLKIFLEERISERRCLGVRNEEVRTG